MLRKRLTDLPVNFDIPDTKVAAPLLSSHHQCVQAMTMVRWPLRKKHNECVLPDFVRFQLSLPTPINVLILLNGPYAAAVEPLY